MIKKLFLIFAFILWGIAADYPTIPNTFSPVITAKSSQINDNFSSLLNGIIDGTKKINVNQLYINSNLAVDNDRSMTLTTLTITGNAAIQGNEFLSGNFTADGTGRIATLNTTTLSATIGTIGTATITSATVTVATITTMNPNGGILNVVGGISCNSRIYDKTGFVMPVGVVLSFAGPSTNIPVGFLYCDGRQVSRNTYADLFAVIGTAHGSGDGSALSFNLPDYRGRFLRGVNDLSGRDPDVATRTAMNAGGNVSDNVGSVQTDEFKAHTHTEEGTSAANYDGSTGAGVAASAENTGSAGGNETRPLNAYVNWIIKY